jgi:hypothetical protein
MTKQQSLTTVTTGLADQPFLYEIRVKGQLSEEQWTAWFDDLAVSHTDGETILRGSLPDSTALYGLLARFRDLAVRLVSVNVLDSDAQRRLLAQGRRADLLLNLLLILVYLLLVGGLAAVTVFISAALDTALALAMLFAALGALAYAFHVWSEVKWWLYVTYLMWPGALLTFFIYLSVAQIVNTALVIAAILFLLAGGLIYLAYTLRGRSQAVKGALVEWEALGGPEQNAQDDRSRYAEAIERDRAAD